MSFVIRSVQRYSVQFKVLIFVLCMIATTSGYAAKEGRPFWTEKSAFIEGEELFVVGVASKARTVEEGRRLAFEQGKVELMNFAQVTSLEAQGLVIETQMTFEEPNADSTVTVFRLLRVPVPKLVSIQGRLKAEGRVQEQAIDQSRKELAVLQQTLTEKATKLNQQQREVEELSREIKGRIKSRSQQVCQLVAPGMTMSEVKSLLGSPDAGDGFFSTNRMWTYGTEKIFFDYGGLAEKSGCIK